MVNHLHGPIWKQVCRRHIVFFDPYKRSFTRIQNNARLFADKMNLPVANLKSNLSKINARANQWKISFKANPTKQFIFYIEMEKTSHPPLNFKNNPIKQILFQKHLESVS